MPSLLELQDAMRRGIVGRDDVEALRYIVDAGIAPQERLSVYRNTFEQTLVKALRLSYPAVERLVGAAFFDAASLEFIGRAPPRSSYLNEFGDAFAAFLDQFAPAASVPYLGDVARLEWAVSHALHAPDAAPLAISSLAAVDPADHARICFEPHPSLGLVHTAYPAHAIWRAVLDDGDAALAAIDLSGGPAWLLVQRDTSGIDVVPLDETLWQFVRSLCSGHSLGSALADHPGVDAATVLADFLAHGRFTGFRLVLGLVSGADLPGSLPEPT